MRKGTVKDDVLREICGGEVVSGGALASRLGVSRTAVWKAVNALRAEGYTISSLLNGYVLSPYNTRLCGEQLKNTVCAEKLIFKDVTVSTNEDIKAVAGDAPEFTVAAARRQTGGKGRLGRGFFSPEGGLYFSVLLRPSFSAEACLKITTAAACAAAYAIEAVSGRKAEIKWVNDIYVSEKKVCGILTEGAFDAENGALSFAVLGVGINAASPKGGFPEEIKDKAGALFSSASPPSLSLCALLNEFLKRFKEYYKNIGKMPHIEEYRRRNMLDGRRVTYERDGESFAGVVCGIGDNAELLVNEKGKTVALSSGEVRLTDYE